MDMLEELRSLGWYLNEAGLKKVSPPNNKCNDVNEIIKLCLDIDFREIAEGALSARRGETLKGPIVLQLQWARNIAAPKISETSSAPRMLCLELSDGQTSIKALEVEKVPALDLNIPPGTKIRFKAEQLQLLGGYLLLRNQELQILGGHVAALEEKWEFARSMQLYAKNGRRASGTTGPPPWVAFGKNLDAVTENAGLSKERNFKSLQIAMEKEKENKDNEEFNAMRNEAIAEAAKAGTKKIFGGGGQQILDYNIKKILDKGYSEEDARQFLRATNNNLERALYNLKRRQESKQNESSSKASGSNQRAPAPSRDTGSRRGASKGVDEVIPTKPVGNVSLFDFLTDKLPANAQKPAISNDVQKNITNKQSSPQPSQAASTNQAARTTSNYTQGSSQHHQQQQQQQQQQPRQSEAKSSRYTENRDNRQQGGRHSKPDSTNESNRRDKFNSGTSGGGGGSSGSGPNFTNKQNGRGNRNSYNNNDNNNRRGGAGGGGESERGSRKPQVNNNSNQNAEINANTQPNSTQQNSDRIRGEKQNNRSNTNRNQQRNRNHQQQQQQQQQYTHNTQNAPQQKQSYGQRQKQPQTTPQPAANNVNNISMPAPSVVHTVTTGNVPTTVASTTTLLPNGLAYDPSKIIGFQSKEANEYAMNLMRSQGKSIGAEAIMSPSTHPLQQQQPKPPQPQPPIQFIPQPAPMPPPIATAVPVTVPIAAAAPMPPPHHFGMTAGLPSDAWNWKIGDLCMAKYWEDGQYYEAEITGICDKTCVVYYIGYNNHEEVLKTDCLPITDANHRPINNYNLQQAMQVAPPPQPPPPQQAPQQHQPQMRTAMRYYVPPHKRNH